MLQRLLHDLRKSSAHCSIRFLLYLKRGVINPQYFDIFVLMSWALRSKIRSAQMRKNSQEKKSRSHCALLKEAFDKTVRFLLYLSQSTSRVYTMKLDLSFSPFF